MEASQLKKFERSMVEMFGDDSGYIDSLETLNEFMLSGYYIRYTEAEKLNILNKTTQSKKKNNGFKHR